VLGIDDTLLLQAPADMVKWNLLTTFLGFMDIKLGALPM
jgi:hypothetical protein